MASSFRVGNHRLGDGPALVIAEVAQAHDGSLGMAHSYIDAAAAAGAGAVKFQTHIAAAESTLDEPFRVPMSGQDLTRYDYWRRMEFTPEQWARLAVHAAERGLIFLSSPFSVEAVRLLAALDMAAWKIGSGEVFDHAILDTMAGTGRPILLSSGMSGYAEIEQGVAAVRDRGLDVAVFQCTSRYPTELTQIGLNVLDELRRRFACPVGLSDHSGQLYPGLAALALGAELIEMHVAFDRRQYGPDAKASLTFDELAQLTRANEAFALMRANPVDKDRMAEEMAPMRALFSKSVAVREALPAGTVLSADMLTVKKPGTGIPAAERERLIGRCLARAVSPERLLRPEDLT